MTFSSYPKVYTIGHRMIQSIFEGPVEIEEKVDGSQFSFGIIDGELMCKSRNRFIDLDCPDKLFSAAVDTVRGLDLVPEWVYRGEVLCRPKHNVLKYDRVPHGNIIIFDVMTGPESYLNHADKTLEANSLGLEVVPLLYAGENYVAVDLLEADSVLGGVKIEGFVVKNHNRFCPDGKPMVGKVVSAAFKEIHGKNYKADKKTKADVVTMIAATYTAVARWEKAVQHLREDGRLTETPSDIGGLMTEIKKDIEEECADEIKDALWTHFKREILGKTTNGFPQWYKAQLG